MGRSRAELGIAAVITASATDVGAMWLLGEMRTVAWQAHGADLARALSDKDFFAVTEAGSKLRSLSLTGARSSTP